MSRVVEAVAPARLGPDFRGLMASTWISNLGDGIALPPIPPRPGHTHVRRDIADGLRWLMNHPPVRTLALVIVTFNITWAASWAMLVLWSLDVLHMGPVGYGLLTTAAAAGGVIGTFGYGWLERHVALATLMRTCLALEVVMHLGFAVTTVAWIALLIMFGFGLYAFVWGTLSQAVRQRVVPLAYQGRVGSVYSVAIYGGVVLGSGVGGLIAEHGGVTAPSGSRSSAPVSRSGWCGGSSPTPRTPTSWPRCTDPPRPHGSLSGPSFPRDGPTLCCLTGSPRRVRPRNRASREHACI